MNKKEYGFLIKMLFFISGVCMRLLQNAIGKFGTYVDFDAELTNLEKEYKKEIQQ